MIVVTMGGFRITGLVDTGASSSLLREDIFMAMAKRVRRTHYVRNTQPLQGIAGVRLPLTGCTEVKVDRIVNPLPVDIITRMGPELIIGQNWLRQGKAVIDFPKRSMLWFESEWPILKSCERGAAPCEPRLPCMDYPEGDEVIREYADVFSGEDDPNGVCDLLPMRIKTIGEPISLPAYRTPLAKRRLVDGAIEEMLATGVIRPSSSPWAAPVTLVPKKDGATRFCVDYRRLNEVTVKDQFPLPHIQDIFDQVGGSKVFSALDLKAGYWQVPVHPDDKEKTAFRCHRGHYEFNVMPFGLCNAPAVFSRLMDRVLGELIGKCVMVYIDDLVIFSQNREDHARDVGLVLEKLRQAGLKVKPSKCEFAKEEISLLGYKVGQHGIRADPEKVRAIEELDTPSTVTQVRSFLGMANYYRQCIPNFAKVAAPLVALTKKHVRFTWGEEEARAFGRLKELLTSSHVMAAPRLGQPYRLYTDACNYAVGGILVQEDDEGVERVIQYISHQLSGSQLRWATIEKEAYAVVYAIEKLRPYLYGAEFTVYTDHKPLTSLFTKQLQNTKIQRWGVLLAEYGATIKYRQGKNNIRADMLSRIEPRREPEVGVIDTEEWVDPQAFPESDTKELLPLIHDGLDLAEIGRVQPEEFPDLKAQAEGGEEGWELINGVIYGTNKPYPTAAMYPRLLLPKRWQHGVIMRAHRDVGHMATGKTLFRLTDSYLWPGMKKDVQVALQKCPVCQAHSEKREYVPMGEMPIATYPMQVIGMDLIELARSKEGYKYALTIIDHCTGWAEVYPLYNKTNESVWAAWSDQFLPRHGVPEVIITDNGQEFCAKDWEEYLKQLGVDHRHTTPIHPQSNGKTERFNRTFKQLLGKAVNNLPSTWPDKIGACLTAYRNSVSSTTGFTPYYLLYGRHARLPMSKTLSRQKGSDFGNRLDDLSTALRTASQLTLASRNHNRQRLQQKANAGRIEVGDTVVLKADPRLKLTSRWDPKWQVTKVSGLALHVRNQLSGVCKVVNREKVKLVDPELVWDEVNPRPKRDRKRKPAFYDGKPAGTPATQEDPLIHDGNQAEEPAILKDSAQQTLTPQRALAKRPAGQRTADHDRSDGKRPRIPEAEPSRCVRTQTEAPTPTEIGTQADRPPVAQSNPRGTHPMRLRDCPSRKRPIAPSSESQKRARTEAVCLVARLCGSAQVPLTDIPTWQESAADSEFEPPQRGELDEKSPKWEVNQEYNRKVSIWVGDISDLRVDAIVNAANESLLGGGGVDGVIHGAAGPGLRAECAKLSGCQVGEAKITKGHKLPAKHVIHTVGPQDKSESKLDECYYSCLEVLTDSHLRSVAFPCIATGAYDFPNDLAAKTALRAVRYYLETIDVSLIDRIIFCLYSPEDIAAYERWMPHFFPVDEPQGVAPRTGQILPESQELVIRAGLYYDEEGPTGRWWEVRRPVSAPEGDESQCRLYVGWTQ